MAPYAQADHLGFATKTLHADHHLLVRPEVAPSISGLAATFAVLLHVIPDVIAITAEYPGVHESIAIYRKTRGEDRAQVVGLDDEYPSDKKLLVWLETPVNPTGECKSIEAYAKKAHAVKELLAIDSTFAPPPIQDPFKWGADLVMHSATKYFGGHSDLLCGIVSVREKADWLNLFHNRTYTGSTEGSLESWLLLRSLRTLSVRITRQVQTATKLAHWLNTLTSHFVRVSVGLEDFEDLKADVIRGLNKVLEIEKAESASKTRDSA